MTVRTRKLAFATIKEVAKAAIIKENYISYRTLAERLGMKNTTGQGLGPILDHAAELCMKHDLPDVTANVVSQSSLDRGAPMPSDASFNEDGFWPITGVHKDEVQAIQKQVIEFAWLKVRELNLKSTSE